MPDYQKSSHNLVLANNFYTNLHTQKLHKRFFGLSSEH